MAGSVFFSNVEGLGIRFSLPVLHYFDKFRQIEEGMCESGGQLFALFGKDDIPLIVDVTGPNDEDVKNLNYFEMDKDTCQKQICQSHSYGLHYIGDWHTHPQSVPVPSDLDLKSMKECFTESKHTLPYFLMVIVGTQEFPTGLHVSLHNDKEVLTLEHLVEST